MNSHTSSFPCRFCTTAIGPGATVCTGCQAERHVGAASGDLFGCGLLGFVICVMLEMLASLDAVSNIEIAFLAVVGSILALAILQRRRVRWTRRQRTFR